MDEYGMKVLKKLAAVAGILCIAIIGLRIYILQTGLAGIPGFEYFEAYSHSLLGIALFLVFYIVAGNVKGKRIFDISDKYSYSIYLVHHVFILGPFSLMGQTANFPLNLLCTLTAITAAAVVLKAVTEMFSSVADKRIGRNSNLSGQE